MKEFQKERFFKVEKIQQKKEKKNTELKEPKLPMLEKRNNIVKEVKPIKVKSYIKNILVNKVIKNKDKLKY